MAAEPSLRERLSAPFDPSEIKWKPQAIKGNSALAVAFADARVIMDRLDDVFGIGCWTTSYREHGDSVVCRLGIRSFGEWVYHEDVGSKSEQPDDGDKLKSAFSDALKRVAIHLGIGRYLYSLPHQWCDYDPAKRKFVKTPTLPAWAIPKTAAPEQQKHVAVQPSGESDLSPSQIASLPRPQPGQNIKDLKPQPMPSAEQRTNPTPAAPNPKALAPATGKELQARLAAKDKELADAKKIKKGQLVQAIVAAGVEEGYSAHIPDWNEDEQIQFAIRKTKAIFEDLSAGRDPFVVPEATGKPFHEPKGEVAGSNQDEPNGVKEQPTGKMKFPCPWNIFYKWVEECAMELALDRSFEPEDTIKAAIEVAIISGAVKGNPVAQNIAEQVEAYFLQLSSANDENES